MSRTSKYIWLFATLFLLMLPSNLHARSSLISEADEISMGQNAAQTIIAKHGLTNDTGLQEKAAVVFDRLLTHTARKTLPYKLQVTAEKQINAYAYPGGQIFVTEGLMRQISTDDELAFVLGHELGHSEGYHITKNIERTFLIDLLTSFLFQENRNIARFLSPVLQIGLSRGYGFSNEHDADRYGFSVAVQAGFNPAGGAIFFHELQDKYGEGSGSIANFINPHPKNSVRIAKELAYIKEYSGERVEILIPLKDTVTAAEIHIDQQPALIIQASRGGWSASQRAEWIAGNISRLLHEEKKIDPAKFSLRKDAEENTEIIYDTRILASVCPEDAAAAATDTVTLANRWLAALTEAFAKLKPHQNKDRCQAFLGIYLCFGAVGEI